MKSGLPVSQPLTENKTSSLQTRDTYTYLQAATSDNTRRAYRADIRHFEQWGGQLPATTDSLIAYLHTFAPTLNPRTLSRRLTALKHWHTYQGFADPTLPPIIAKTLTGIRRTHGRHKEKARALHPEQLTRMVRYWEDQADLLAVRNIALLQIGYFGALRRSELVAIQYGHIEWQTQGIQLLIPTSKTDPTHEGQYCAIPLGNTQLCPVKALQDWLSAADIHTGYIFCPIRSNRVLHNQALSPDSVNQIIKKSAQKAEIEDWAAFSSHSLRCGLATHACREGASMPAIMRQGRWKQVNTVMEYIEAANRFEDNAASAILNQMPPVECEETES